MSQAYTEEWLVGPQATNFYTRTYTPTVPTTAAVVFVHGFAEHIGRYTHFHPLLAARGIAVFTYDSRGFGLTALDTTGKKSKSSAYGKTSWKDQMGDVAWAIEHAKKTFNGVPLFLMGHSMGGGEVLGFGTQGEKGAHIAVLKSLTAVIATSPLIQQTTPANGLMKWVGSKLCLLMPNLLVPAPVNEGDLAHDPAVGAEYLKDPLVKTMGSLRGINDMLSQGELLLSKSYTRWPKELPLLIIHGTEDKVTSYQASQGFHDKVDATKKKITLFPGGYHELQNEPDGVKEKLAEELIAYIEANLGTSSTATATVVPAPVVAAAQAEPVKHADTEAVGDNEDSKAKL